MPVHTDSPNQTAIPAYALYGEGTSFPDIVHCERVADRAEKHAWAIAPHRHNGLHQFYLIQSGSGTVTLDGRALAVSPNVLVNVPRGAVHGVRFVPPTNGLVLTIPTTEMPEFSSAGHWLGAGLARGFAVSAPPDLPSLFETFYAEFQSDSPGRAVMLRGLVLQIACIAARTALDDRKSASSYSPYMAQFAELARRHVPENWGVARYAQALGVSRVHLNRVCRRETGMTAQHFIEAQRFREAARLLAYTVKSVSAIAYDLGFDDPSYFSRAFRRAMGITPSDYRTSLSA